MSSNFSFLTQYKIPQLNIKLILAVRWYRHNIIEDHSAQHSFYTESLMIQFFPAIAAKVTALGSGILPSVPLSSNSMAGPSDSGPLIDVD